MEITEQIVEKINQIIQLSNSADTFIDQCKYIANILQDLDNIFTDLHNPAGQDQLTPLLDILNKLYEIVSEFKIDKLNMNIFNLQIIQTILDLKNVIQLIYHLLHKINIQVSNKDDTTSQNIISGLKNFRQFFSDLTAKKNLELNDKLKKIEKQLDDINQIKEYEIQTILSDMDSYSTYKGFKKSTKEEVTIKIFKPNQNVQKTFDSLIKIHESINHSNLESFVESSEPSPYFIVTNRNGQELSAIINNNANLINKTNIAQTYKSQNISLQAGYRTIISIKIAMAIGYLHSLNIVHGDLCSANITIDESLNPQVINFSNSQFLSEDFEILSLKPSSLSSAFIAPELCVDEAGYNESIDTFSFGGLLYELLTSESPFGGCSNIETKIKLGQRPTIPEEASPELRKLIEKSWSQEPNDRPSFSDIIYDILQKQITFPGDENSEAVKQFFKQNSIINEEIIFCCDICKKISDTADQVFVYNHECNRIRSLIHSYEFYLITSNYATNRYCNEQDLSKIQNLKKALNLLQLDLKQICPNEYLANGYNFKVEEMAMDLFNLMNNVFIAMFDLKFKVSKYDFNTSDIVRDFRRIFGIFKEYSGIKINEDEEFNEQNLKSERNIFVVRMKEINHFLRETGYTSSITQEEVNKRINIIFNEYHDYYVKRDDFTIIKLDDASGASAFVHKGKQKSTGKLVAIKEFKKNFLNEDSMKYLKREITFLLTLHYKYLVPFIGFNNDDKQPLWIISEYIEGGDLFDANSNSAHPLTDFVKTKIAFEIAEGMEYLHSKSVIHRDLKTNNILLKNGDTPLIVDFGYARSDISIQMTRSVGTYNYMAPEVIKNNGIYDFKADVYSFAMILWELYSGEYPFKGMDDKNVLERIINNAPLPFSKGKIPMVLRKLIDDARNFEPSQRPTFTEIIERMIKEKISYGAANPEEIENFYNKKAKQRKNQM